MFYTSAMFSNAIWVHLRAQLGNQMFQHAAGVAAAKAAGVASVRHFGEKNLLAKPFGIGPGPIRLKAASWQAKCGLRFGMLHDHPMGDWVELAPGVFAEQALDWQGVHAGHALQGWCQSAGAVRSLKDDVNTLFRFSPSCAAAADDALRSAGLNPETTCAVHMRMGDYRTSDMGLAHPTQGWVLPVAYYRAALERIPAGVRLALFSDEPDAALERLRPFRRDWVVVRGNTGIVDMCAISRCRHVIGSNSTFAWWAAKLGVTKGTVVFPEYFLGWYRKVWFPVDIKVEGWEWIEVSEGDAR